MSSRWRPKQQHASRRLAGYVGCLEMRLLFPEVCRMSCRSASYWGKIEESQCIHLCWIVDNLPWDAHRLEVELPMYLCLVIWINGSELKQILFGYNLELDGFGDASFEYKCHALIIIRRITINEGKLIDVCSQIVYFQISSSPAITHNSQQTGFIRMQLLSENAIIHISAGFEGPFILQTFGVRRDLYKRSAYNFCLTDGEVYIGAIYECGDDVELDNYYLVQITAKFQDRFHPLTIRTLEVLSTAPRKLAGKPPCTLQDYFNREVRGGSMGQTPRKKLKKDEVVMAVPGARVINAQKVANNQNTRQQTSKKPIINLQHDKRTLKLASQSEEEPPQKYENQPEQIKLVDDSKSLGKNSPYIEQNQRKDKMYQKTCELKELYERAAGWVILCRVNYMSIVECQNGLFAANFIISDQAGTEMKCVYFVAQQETARQKLTIGNYYLLTGGEVKYVTKQKQLQITFDKNSDIIQQHNVYFPPQPGKFIRIDQIMDEQHLNIVNVLGVIRRIKSKQTFKSKTKYTATLSDAIKKIEVDFMLFLNNGEKEIKVGMIIVLHNFQVFKQQNIYRLNSTYKSYYFKEKPTHGSQDIISVMSQVIENSQWDTENYRNISMFAFTNRTISDLKEITTRTEDQRLYSSLDVLTLDIARKKSYQACRICKRPADKKEMGLYECVHCKKMIDTITTHALSVTFADFTGSIDIDVIGQHAQNLLNMKANEFNMLGMQQQMNYLKSLKFKNVIVRLKSEKKADKKDIGHSVWGIERPSPQHTIREIKKRLQINRLKHEENW